MAPVDKNVVEGMEDRGEKRWEVGDDFVRDSVLTPSFLGIQMLQFGIQLWECNTIFTV